VSPCLDLQFDEAAASGPYHRKIIRSLTSIPNVNYYLRTVSLTLGRASIAPEVQRTTGHAE
jgi:hypothetical protein